MVNMSDDGEISDVLGVHEGKPIGG
jgi:hypothetical protein